MTSAEIYLDFLNRTFGKEDAIRKEDCPQGGPPISVFVYRDLPEPGFITGVTYGLSWLDYSAWTLSRPELIVSVESTDVNWAIAAAFFAAAFRGIKRFQYGDVFTTDTSLANDTEMDGFLLFAQSLLEPNEAVVELDGYKVTLAQLYPIYSSELDLYSKIGLEKFWKHPDFDIYDVKRKPISE